MLGIAVVKSPGRKRLWAVNAETGFKDNTALNFTVNVASMYTDASQADTHTGNSH